MSGERKVIWTEDMFLRPQHFQQQEQSFTQWRIARRADGGIRCRPPTHCTRRCGVRFSILIV